MTIEEILKNRSPQGEWRIMTHNLALLLDEQSLGAKHLDEEILKLRIEYNVLCARFDFPNLLA